MTLGQGQERASSSATLGAWRPPSRRELVQRAAYKAPLTGRLSTRLSEVSRRMPGRAVQRGKDLQQCESCYIQILYTKPNYRLSPSGKHPTPPGKGSKSRRLTC